MLRAVTSVCRRLLFKSSTIFKDRQLLTLVNVSIIRKNTLLCVCFLSPAVRAAAFLPLHQLLVIFSKYFSPFSAVCLCIAFWGHPHSGFLTRMLLSPFFMMTSLRKKGEIRLQYSSCSLIRPRQPLSPHPRRKREGEAESIASVGCFTVVLLISSSWWLSLICCWHHLQSACCIAL